MIVAQCMDAARNACYICTCINAWQAGESGIHTLHCFIRVKLFEVLDLCLIYASPVLLEYRNVGMLLSSEQQDENMSVRSICTILLV